MKNILKKLSISILSLTLCFTLCACELDKKENTENDPCAPLKDAEVTLVYADLNPLDSVVGQMGLAFKQKVEELSNGTMTIDLRMNGSCGNIADILEDMKTNNSEVSIIRLSPTDIIGLGYSDQNLLTIPYLFTSRDQYWKFATSDLADEFFVDPTESNTNLKGLFFGEEGFRCFFSSSELTDVTSLALLKIRMNKNELSEKMIKCLYAYASYDEYTELYNVLASKKIDAAENPISNYLTNKFYEVAPNLILDNHLLGITEVLINNSTWSNLSKPQKNILIEAGKYAQEYNKNSIQKQEDESLEKLKELGVNIVEVTDFTEWKNTFKSVINEYSQKNPDLYNKLIKVID